MHRNTLTLVILLAVFAALVTGVNIGKSMRSDQSGNQVPSPSPTTADAEIPMVQPTAPVSRVYTHTECGVLIEYPPRFSIADESSRSAVFVRDDGKDSIILTCQADIPKPAIPASSIESLKLTHSNNIGTISGKIYHTESMKDGAKMDSLIYYNSTIGMDVFVAGYGPDFTEALKTIRIYP